MTADRKQLRIHDLVWDQAGALVGQPPFHPPSHTATILLGCHLFALLKQPLDLTILEYVSNLDAGKVGSHRIDLQAGLKHWVENIVEAHQILISPLHFVETIFLQMIPVIGDENLFSTDLEFANDPRQEDAVQS